MRLRWLRHHLGSRVNLNSKCIALMQFWTMYPFPHYCKETLDSNNLRKGAFTLRTESEVFHCGEGIAAGTRGSWPSCVQRREMNAGAQLTFSFPWSPGPPALRSGAAHIQGQSSYLNFFSGDTLTDTSKGVSPRRFPMHPGNPGDEPSY